MARDPYYIRLIATRRWRELRKRVLEEHPLCRDCELSDRVELATEVHHIVPVESEKNPHEMERLAYSPSNLVALCHGCHKQRHRELRSNSRELRKERDRKLRDNFEKEFYS